MSILVNFEDTYGIADLACKNFFGELIPQNVNEKDFDGILVRRALSTGNILKVRTIPADIDKIIFVYDMDKQRNKDEENILEPDALEEKIVHLQKSYTNKELLFVPVHYAAETICLDLFSPGKMDFSLIFSSENTAHLHAKMLEDKLAELHPDINDARYWARHGLNKHTFLTKRTRNYIDDLHNVEDVYPILTSIGFSKYNKSIYEWLIGKDITDTSMLLDATKAIEQQVDYKNVYTQEKSKGAQLINFDNRIYDTSARYK